MVSKVDGIEIPVITKLEDVDKLKNDVKNLANNIKSAMNNLQKELGNITLTLSHIYRSKKPETQLKWINQLANKDIPNLIQKIKGIGNSADKATKDLGKFGNEGTKSVSKLSNSFKDLALRMRSLTYYYAGSFLIRSVTDMIASLSSLQASFANIQAITASSNTQMTKLQKTIFDVASSTRYTTEEISEATTILGQAGLSVEQIQGTLMQTAVLASATGTSVAETANNMTSVLAVWNMTADQTSRIADTFVTAINGSKATMQTMSQAIQYAGVQLADMGVSFEEVTAAAAGTANAGMKVRSMIGTGMRSLVTELQAPTKKVIDGLEKYGLTVEDVSIETYGLIGVMRKLKEAGIDGSNAFDFLNKRSATFLVAASSQLDAMDHLRKAFADEGAAARANEIQMNTLNAQMIVFKQTMQELLYETLEPFTKLLTQLLKGINGLFKVLNDSIGQFILQVGIASIAINKLLNLLGKLSGAAGVFGTAIGTSSLAGATKNVGHLTKAFTSLGKVLKGIVALLGGIKGVIIAIVATMAYWAFDKFKSSAEQLEEVSAKTQKYEESVNSAESAIDELNKKQELYVNDSQALNTRIMELNKQFGEQGLELIKLGETYDFVLEKMIKFQAHQMRQTATSKMDEAELLKSNPTGGSWWDKFSVFGESDYEKANRWSQVAYQGLKSGTASEEGLRNIISDMNVSDEVKQLYTKALNAVVEAYNNELTSEDLNLQANLVEANAEDISVTIEGLDKVASDVEKTLVAEFKAGKIDSKQLQSKMEQARQDNVERVIEDLESLYDTASKSYGDLLQDLKKAILENNSKATSEIWNQIQLDLGNSPLVSGLKIQLSKAVSIFDDKVIEAIKIQIAELENKLKATTDEKLRKEIQSQINTLSSQAESIESFQDILKDTKNNKPNKAPREKRDPFLTNMKSRVSLIEGEGKIYKARSEGERLRLEDEKASEARLHFHDEISKYADQINELNALTQKEAELRALLNSQYGEIIKKYQEAGTAEEKQSILRDLEARGDLGRNQLDAINLANSLGVDIAEGQQRWGATPEEREANKHQLLSDTAFASQMNEWAKPEANSFQNVFSGIMASDGMEELDNQIKSYTKSWTNLFTDLGKQIGDSMQTGMTDAANAIWSGEKSVGEAFGDMGKQILNSLGQFVTQLLVQAAVISALNIIPGMTAALESMDEMAYVKKMTQYAGIASAFSALGGKATGDVTSKKANGGLIGGGVPNRDSVHAMLMPGEYVMKKSAVDALGTNFLSDLNNNAEQTMDNAYEKMDEAKEERKPNDTSIEPSVTNVWVVADRDQAKMGPQDVIATISRDILTGGQTKRLIQSVVAGRK